jgi:hypothetical protein
MSKRDEARGRWEQIVGQYERAGVSQATFAAERRVGLAALRYWIYKLRGEKEGPRRSSREVRLLPVEVTRPALSPAIELRLGDVSIAVPAGTRAEYIAEIVAVLRAARC